jgi:hypothetical protein
MKSRWLTSPILLLLAAPAPPVIALAGPAVTVYTHDLGLVREQRSLELSGSRDTVRIADLPERLDFSSLRLVPSGSARVTRLAYRWDVASGDALIDGARGRRLRIVSRGDRVTEGTLVTSDGSWLVVRLSDGSLTTVARGQVDAVSLADPPANLSLRPTLEAAIEGGSRGKLSAELSYLTGGLSWDAEHVVVRRGEKEATWSANVTIDNSTGRDFVDADLKLVAGEPSRTSGMPAAAPPVQYMARAAEMKSGADLEEQTFSEYHLYSLGRPATIRSHESQSLTMIDPHSVTMTPRYFYRGGDSRGVVTQLEMTNSKENGLGVPLPAGRVRFYESDASGGLQFTGETRIKHTPAGEKLTLDVGSAFDLSVERRQTAEHRISDREREYSYEIKLRNHKDRDVVIVCDEPISGDFDVTAKSHEFTRKDSNTLEFNVPVPAGKEAKLTYTARVRY